MTKKRFNVVKSNIVEDAWFIKDELKIFTFPAVKGDSKILFTYCKALNKLNDNNKLSDDKDIYKKFKKELKND